MNTLRQTISASAPRGSHAFALVLAMTCLAACGSEEGDDGESTAGAANGGSGAGAANGGSGAGATTAFLACASDTFFHLAGELGGEAIDIREAPTTGGFSQQSNPPGPHFRVPNDSSEDSEQLVVVYLTWSDTVANGEVTPVAGFVRLPLAGPLPGQTICAGVGSEMRIAPDDEEAAVGEFQFRLLDLAGGDDCSEARGGELRGCWRN